MSPGPNVPRRQVAGMLSGVVLGASVVAYSWVDEHLDVLDVFDSNAQVGQIWLNNEHTAAHEFRVVIDVSGRQQYDETHTVPAQSERHVVDGLPSTWGRVSVTASVEDASGGEERASHVLGGDACYGVGVNYASAQGVWLTSGAPVDTCETSN